jgi:hypothetical protein
MTQVCLVIALCELPHQVMSPSQITAAITDSSTEQQLAALIQQHLDSMNAINLAAAIMKLPKLRCRDQQLYASCVQRYLHFASEHTAWDLSNVVYALCKSPHTIRQQQQAAIQQLLSAFLNKLPAAAPQSLSNVLYGMAISRQQLEPAQLQLLLDAFVGVLQRAAPQAVSNTLWAVATLGQQLQDRQLQQLLYAFVSTLQQAKPQNVANTVWAVATMGKQVPEGQLQQLLTAIVSMLQQANPQNVSNTLWAVATMGQQVPEGQLQQLLSAFVSMLQLANTQAVSNTLWACAKLRFLPQQLLAAPELAGLLAAGTPQGLANAAWACGQLGHRDEQLVGALLAETQQQMSADTGTGSAARRLNSQILCNFCWSVAVLDLQQQHTQHVLQLAEACSSMWGSTEEAGKWQLWQVHTWLLDSRLAGGQGLQGSLTEQQLQQCKAAWDRQMQETTQQEHTDFQGSVFAAVQRLGIAWQQQPQMESDS